MESEWNGDNEEEAGKAGWMQCDQVSIDEIPQKAHPEQEYVLAFIRRIKII